MQLSGQDDRDDPASFGLVVRGPRWVCTFASPSCEATLGRTDRTITGTPVLELLHPEDRDRLQLALDGLSRAQRADQLHVRLLVSGRPVWFEVQVHTRGRNPGEAFIAGRDATGRHATPVREVVAAQTDPLTGAMTRPMLLDHARQALRRLQREPLWVALLFVDLDRLKLVNDNIGHHAGDAVLRELTRRVGSLLRPVDTLARLGGDEFTVLVGDLHDPSDAHLLAKRIVALSRVPFSLDGTELDCSVSVGLTVTADPSTSVEALLRQADVAMYQAKASGRGRWRAWGAVDEDRVNAQHRVEELLSEALRSRTVVLEYQPVVRLLDDQPVGSEALLRVVGPDGAVLRPAAFLEVATSQRLIGPLDLEVLRLATTYQHQGAPGTIDLNLAVPDLEDSTWAEAALEQLARSGDDLPALRVELREELLRQLSPTAVGRLEDLRNAGVRVGLDSFGSGVSGLSTLWSFPLDYVKLHPSITAQLPTVRSARALVRAVCEMAHGLDLVVVANGVETAEQRDLVRDQDCDEAEGFLWPAWTPRKEWAPPTGPGATANGHHVRPSSPARLPGAS